MKLLKTEKAEFFETKVTGVVSVFDENTKKLVSRPRMDEFEVNIQASDIMPMLGIKLIENGREIYLSLMLNDLTKFVEKVAKETSI